MQILSLTLEDIKSYPSATIRFAEGVNAIVGHNGAGKSTILEAIGYALFDMLGYNNREFVREGAKEGTITVALASGYDDRVYHVIRRCGRGNQYQVYDPGLNSKVCEGKADVLTFLRQHMGVEINADLEGLFRDAVGVPQGTFTAAFLQTAAQRKNVFDPLLRVEEYREAAERLYEPRRVLRERQQTLEVQLATLSARLERLPLLEEQQSQRQQEITAIGPQLQQLRAELKLVQQKRATLDEVRKELTQAQQRQQQAAQQVKLLQSQLAQVQKSVQEAQVARTLLQTHQAAHDQFLAAQQQQQQLDQQVRSRQKLLDEQAKLDKALALAQREIDTNQRDLLEILAAETLVAALTVSVAEQDQHEQRLASLRQQQAQLSEIQTSVKRQQQELQRTHERCETLRSQLSKGDVLRGSKEKLVAQLDLLQTQQDEQRTQLAQFKAEADALKAHSKALEQVEGAQCPICKQSLTAQHRQHLNQENQTQVERLRASYASVQQNLKALESRLSSVKTETTTLDAELLRLPRAEELQESSQRVQQLQEELRILQQRQLDLARIPEEIATTTQQLTALNNPRSRSQVAAAQAARRKKVETSLTQAQTMLEQAQQQLSALQIKLQLFQDLDAAIARVSETLKHCVNGYQQVLTHRRLADSLEDQQTSLNNLLALLHTAQGDLEEHQTNLEAIQARFDPNQYQQLLEKEQAVLTQEASLQAKLIFLQQELEKILTDILQLHTQRANSALLKEQKERLHQLEQTLESVRQALKQAGPQITKALIQQISSNAAQIFGDLMQDYSRRLQWNEDYSVTLEVDGRQRQFAQLSGGEQMTAALAVRLAFLREMSNIDVAFFDEPTTNLDDARRESLARQILDVRGFRQLFVISHDDTFEQATQHVIRVTRIDGHSQITDTH